MSRPASQHSFAARDGSQIFYRAWSPQKKASGKSLLLFHRGHEHSGRFQELVDSLEMPDCSIYAWDCRGCGQSPGPRGDARGLGQLESDMEMFFQHLQREQGLTPEKTIVVAHSVAAVVAGLWVLDYGPKIRGLVLATPALSVKLYVPFAREGLTVLNVVGLMTQVSSYVKGRALTHDREQAQVYDQDPLVTPEISTRLLLDLYKGAKRLQEHAHSIHVPTQVMVARADWVIKNQPIRELYRRLPNPKNEIKVYAGFFHAVFHEKERHRVFADLRDFCSRVFKARLDSRSHLQRAHLEGPSAESFEWLKAGPPPLSLGNLLWKSTRLSMRTLGRVSQGLRLGLARGFSSGETLDYVYENKARGWTPFGKLVDKFYLESIGWRCIRQRRKHMLEILDTALAALDGKGTQRLADIAGGPGRYLLDFLSSHPQEDLEVVVRDADEGALAKGRELAADLGEERISYRVGDAFSPESLGELGELDVAVVSGLYELFPCNEKLEASLGALGEQVRKGGFLIYTNQPSHPQLELIAETLTHQNKERWVMRCRSTAEMDELVSAAGFRKEASLIDDHGIFSVSLAQRR